MKKIAILVFSIIIVMLCTLQLAIIKDSIFQKPEKADVIIVLGCRLYGDRPSPMLTYRLEKAFSLYNDGYAEYIIVSGGQGEDEWIPEAEAMKKYLVKKGIPTDRIFEEAKSFSTYENLKLSKVIMEDMGFETAIIVTSGYHIRRALLIANRLDIEASGGPAEVYPNIFVKARNNVREVLAYVKDYVKVKGI